MERKLLLEMALLLMVSPRSRLRGDAWMYKYRVDRNLLRFTMVRMAFILILSFKRLPIIPIDSLAQLRMSHPQATASIEVQKLPPIASENGGFVTDGTISCEAFKQQCDSTVQSVREKLAQLESLTSTPPTRENFLMPLDDLMRHIAIKRGLCSTFESLHPDPAMREIVTEVQQRLDKLSIEIDQSSRLAYIMDSVDVEPLDALDRRFVAHGKRDFRRAGCFLAPDQREQVKQLNEREAELGRKFDRNIVDGHKSMFVTLEQLKGMSDEFMRNHPVREDGKIELKTNYADRLPVLEFCEDDGVRKDMWFLANNVRRYCDSHSSIHQDLADIINFFRWLFLKTHRSSRKSLRFDLGLPPCSATLAMPRLVWSLR
jgi:hypothetical protein